MSNSISFIQNKKPVQLCFNDILFIKAAGDYMRLVTPGKVYITHSTMKGIATRVNNNILVRVYRRFIVNILKATIIDERCIQIGNTVIPISKTYKSNILQIIAG